MQTHRTSKITANTTRCLSERKIGGIGLVEEKISACVLPNTVVPCVLWASRTLSKT